MTGRFPLPWALALVISVVLAVVLVPTRFLSVDHVFQAISEHD